MRRNLLVCLCLLLPLSVSADVVSKWKSATTLGDGQDWFEKVAMDDAGNVYATGVHAKSDNDDVFVAKFSPAGVLNWKVRIGAGLNERGRAIAVNPAGTLLCIAFNRGDSGVTLAKLNPANGQILWSKPTNVSQDAAVVVAGLHIDSSDRVFFAATQFKTNTYSKAQVSAYMADGALIQNSVVDLPNPEDRVLGTALRPGGGFYLVEGTDTSNPVNNLIFCYAADGTKNGEIIVPNATAISSSSAQGGTLLAAGVQDLTKVELYRIATSTNTLAKSAENVLTGLTYVVVSEIAAGIGGEMYVAGYENVPFAKFEPFLARYRFSDLAREWRTPRPATPLYDTYRSVSADAFGNVAVSYVQDGNPVTYGAQVFDGASGLKLGENLGIGWPQDSDTFATVVNSAGAFVTVGMELHTGNCWGFAWVTTPRGLKQLTTPMPSYMGGSTVPLTVNMYLPTNAARVVSLTSNSPFAPVPANVTVDANAVSGTANIATLATSVDRTVTISGSFEGVTRTRVFYLIAPRPSSLTITPDTVTGGNPATGQVNITGAAPTGGLTVHLSSDGPEATVPATTSVPAGAMLQTFTVNTTVVVSSTLRTISASVNGVTKTDTLTVQP